LSSSATNKFSLWEKQVIALSAVAQSAQLVHDIAVKGILNEEAAFATVNSLLVLNPDSMDEIYPNLSHLSVGLNCLQEIFGKDRLQQHADVIRYTLGILVLRSKLMSSASMQEQLRNGLNRIDPLCLPLQASQGDALDDTPYSPTERTFEQIAKLYQDTISTLPYRIQVQGNIEYLKNNRNAIRIRALLLAGIRSAVLWYQLGGRRLGLHFYRKRIYSTATTIRRKLIVSV